MAWRFREKIFVSVSGRVIASTAACDIAIPEDAAFWTDIPTRIAGDNSELEHSRKP
jgi:hypothetical protein